MTLLPGDLSGHAAQLAMILLATGLALACVRLVRGPSLADRVVALDFVTVVLIAVATLLAIVFDHAAFLDLGAALALIGFLATVAFARYAERRGPTGRPGRPAAEETHDG